jgi:hypothetical protein
VFSVLVTYLFAYCFPDGFGVDFDCVVDESCGLSVWKGPAPLASLFEPSSLEHLGCITHCVPIFTYSGWLELALRRQAVSLTSTKHVSS